MCRAIISTFFVFSTLLYSLSVSSASLYLDTFTEKQGLSQNSINCSVNDSQGFYWFATQSGLNRFDGYNFKNYKPSSNQTSISGNWVTDCLNEDENHIWFSTASNGLNLFNTKTDQFHIFNSSSHLSIANNQIWSMAKDTNDNLWIGHDEGKLTRLNRKEQKAEVFTLTLTGNQKVLFRDIIIDKNQGIWLASNAGLFRFNFKDKSFKSYENSPDNIWRLALNSQNELVIGTKKGLAFFDLNTNTFTKVEQFKDVWITDILITPDNSIWITSYGQGLFYKAADGNIKQKYIQYKFNEKNHTGLASDYLLSLYRDPQGIMWIGSDGYGLHRYDDKQRQFGHKKHSSNDPKSLSHDFVRAILKDSMGNLWVGTRKGLNKQNENGFERYLNEQGNNSSLSNNNIFALFEDNKGRIWIGTYGGGLLQYSPQSNSFIIYNAQSHNLSSDRVYAITGDTSGNLWLGSNQGVTKFNPDTGNIKHYKNDDTKQSSLSNNTVFSLAYDEIDNALWIGTRKGLNRLNIDTHKFTHYQHEAHNRNTISHNMVSSLHLEQPNTLWVGTFQGLNKLDKSNGKIKSDFEQNALSNQNIFSVKIDAENYLWLATNQGLIRFNPLTQQLHIFSHTDGIQDNSFVLGASYQAADGQLFFGGINGFNQFYPKKIDLTTQVPEPVITELLLFNRPVNLTTETTIINNEATAFTSSYANNLEFNESHGVIGFGFSALNSAASPELYQYAYRLKGIDEQFIYTQASHRQVNYSQLPSGNYQLFIKAADQYGQWSKIKSLIKFKVVPPWWKSVWAYIGYVFIIGVVVWFLILSRYQIILAGKECEKQRELNQLKSQFLDNMSHELKTPLSLILAPLESLLKRHKDANTQQQLTIIQRNSKQLLMFIDQLLQLSQRPSAVVSIVSPYHVNPILKQYAYDFIALFEQKNITFNFTDKCNVQCYLNLEHNHLTSIINNLLSNALKYTQKNGEVSLELICTETTLILSIIDSGIGVEKTQQKHIFERFNRIDNKAQTGSGIGLALVKQLVEQYGGSIDLKSEINIGSCFNVTLPLAVYSQLNDDFIHPLVEEKQTENSKFNHLKTLLIVEDNNDMRTLLLSLFNEQYQCISCENGQQGLELCRTHVPDIVISDVMMPKFDGYQLLNSIRNDIAISHIPVLLLSAKADLQSKIKGLDLLADDYLSKPFEPSLLKSRVNALLSVRELLNQHLRQQLNQNSTSVNFDENMVQSKDYRFTQRLKAVIDEHYHSDLFSVEEFATLLHLSPRALQLKMKALFELTPSDYIRNTRLEHAKELLIHTQLSIGLIAEQTGFSSQSYFARCFKTVYGHSPKQYRNLQKNKNEAYSVST